MAIKFHGMTEKLQEKNWKGYNIIMDIKKSKYFGYTVFALIALLALFLAVKIKTEFGGYNRQFPPSTIMVSGEGSVFVRPDIATISVGVTKTNKDAGIAQKEASVVMDKVSKFLEDQGIEEKDIKTTIYDISPNYEYLPNRSPKITEYRVHHVFQVKIRDLTKVGQVLSGVGVAGANDVGSLSFTVDDQDLSKKEAREKAIKSAKEKAKILSKQLGVRLNKITSYYESEGFNGPVYYDSAFAGKGGDFSPAPISVPTGENEIKVNVSISYEIK